MKLNKVHLKNIRSYEEATINLPEGSVLLSGDIGAGKTTVLLAVEFALFGLQRGGMSGNSLLRTDKSRGLVEVEFEIGEKKITIQRTLKRNKNTATQDTGFISINNEKQVLSPSELKHRVLNLLNYPSEFLTKTNLLYRYTLYTPQEAMREILTETPETRLDTLRKVFGIDKYKRIAENSERFSSVLREGIKKKEGQILHLEEKKQEAEEKEKHIAELSKEILKVNNQLEKAQSLLKEKKSELEKKEHAITRFNELKTATNTKKSELEFTEKTLLELNTEKENLDSEIKELETQTKDFKLEEDIDKKISVLTARITELEHNLLNSRETISSLNTKKSEREQLLKKVEKLSICPVCKQQVTAQHIEKLNKEISAEITNIENNAKEFIKESNNAGDSITKHKEKLKKLQDREKQHQIINLKVEKLQEKTRQLKKTTETTENLATKNKKLASEIKELNEKLKTLPDIEKEYKKSKEEVESASSEEREIAIKKAELDREHQSMQELILSLKNEIQEKEKAKSDLTYLTELKDWLKIHFIPLLGTMEREVMARLHHDFASLLQKWFSMLVTDLDVKLDESFTPIIESRGYELDYAFLSGGERTAAALAYRLALNQVINSLISKIQTHDIIILDEPTDGFSSEQLDRMRTILEDLKVKQLILVSHEAKIEGFVDNIIRFKKEEGKTIIT